MLLLEYECLEGHLEERVLVVGEERGTKETPIVWEGSLSPDFFEEPVDQFPPRARVVSPKSALSEDTITKKKIGPNACMVRTA